MHDIFSISKATVDEAEYLVAVQVKAFQIDVAICGEGPPGYDSVDRQVEIIKSHLYYKITDENTIIGGFYLSRLDSGKYELIRLFVDPAYQRMGIGTMVLNYIEETFNDLEILELQASDFRKDNHAFYEKRGFSKVGEVQYAKDSFSYKYQKCSIQQI
ncbi:Acetyltransferase (GNAT) family protein [Paraliobacillus sp. PM-2]|uniref:GNAT family N-acetyltransferase n=1 Tax=Paraliobacillus sp. PM-2 TaxID=1462524 RepID=UPI00061CB058|nr:GNAT family N-acetyltransferase [Paraliobacillus sp. PM-2]CQR47323.1 Acetyltransferase (GNAT) family protein [Paraliobacillus sp. PM-2]